MAYSYDLNAFISPMETSFNKALEEGKKRKTKERETEKQIQLYKMKDWIDKGGSLEEMQPQKQNIWGKMFGRQPQYQVPEGAEGTYGKYAMTGQPSAITPQMEQFVQSAIPGVTGVSPEGYVIGQNVSPLQGGQGVPYQTALKQAGYSPKTKGWVKRKETKNKFNKTMQELNYSINKQNKIPLKEDLEATVNAENLEKFFVEKGEDLSKPEIREKLAKQQAFDLKSEEREYYQENPEKYLPDQIRQGNQQAYKLLLNKARSGREDALDQLATVDFPEELEISIKDTIKKYGKTKKEIIKAMIEKGKL